MARETIVKGPNYVHPEKPSAVGSRNSLNRHNRDEYQEAKGVIDEEVDKILNHIHAKLPPEVLEKLDIMGSMKSKLHNYFNQDFQNMLNRYLVTMEDEMSKKVRDLVDKEENRTLNRYTAREITEILDRIGGTGTFNTGEIEKSLVNMYSHLQGHVERGMSELETSTNALLREKSDVGAFVRGQNSYAIVKCSFKDNLRRPKTVMDVKLSIGILDSELVSRIYHYQVPVKAIIKDIVAKNIHELIDTEIEEVNHQILDEGREEMTDSERIFEKLRIMDKYISDDDSADSKRYQFVAKKFLDSVDGIQAEIDSKDYDALNIRENIKKIIDKENIRNRGFNTAVNAITSILDTSKMGYQYIENFKNARDCLIREYEEEDVTRLPDERYAIRLTYYDQAQLKALRKAYTAQIEELNREVMHLWNVCDGLYVIDRNEKGFDDWDTLSERMLNPKAKRGLFSAKKEPEQEADDYDKSWNEISFIPAKETVVEKENPTDESRLEEIGARFPVMLKKLEDIYQDVKDERRRVLEARIDFLKEQFEEFANKINPYHVQPGLLLDIDIVSIKKKKTTMMNMANVINEFLFSVSKGFSDAAFVSLSRTRSTERADIDQEFISVVE
ncbi:MAG: cytochrome C oxidase subunit II [Proteobacteria bacterium]|nr:cytochrome C oxidase subunit II [Pseudomonadota bacterium]